jgi:dynein heavy chain
LQDVAFLEDVNMILNTGDIPNLYDNEDRLEIIEKVKTDNFLFIVKLVLIDLIITDCFVT